MTTLLLTYSFPPQRSPRAIQIAHLVRHSALDGLRVVAADDPLPADDGLLSTLPDGLSVTRLPWSNVADLQRRLRERTLKDRALVPDHFRPWARNVARRLIAERTLGPSDVLVSFGQPMSDHLAAARIAQRTGSRWIAHFSDPWIDSPFRSTIAPVRAINARQESRVVVGADRLVFCSPQTLDLVMGKYPEALAAKATVLPHAFDPALYGPPRQPRRTGRMTIRYVGNFYGDRRPDPLYRGLKLLLARRPELATKLRFELIGSFEFDPLASGMAMGLPDGLVDARPAVPYLTALALMADSDLLAVIDAPGRESVFLPSKLIEYLGAGRPIVALSPPGAAADVVRRAGGLVADPGDQTAVAEVLEAALSLADSGIATRAEEDVLALHRADRVAGRFDELVRALGQT